jgi:hypothetical protein
MLIVPRHSVLCGRLPLMRCTEAEHNSAAKLTHAILRKFLHPAQHAPFPKAHHSPDTGQIGGRNIGFVMTHTHALLV